MTAEAGTDRLWVPLPWGTALAARVTPGVAVLLFAATGVAWFLTTGPLAVFRAAGASLDQPVTSESWALLYSSIFGVFALVAGIVGLGSCLVARRPEPSDGEAAPARVLLDDEVARLRRAVRSEGGRGGGGAAKVQLLRAQLAVLETRVRAARTSDPDEIARVVEGGCDAMRAIITELRGMDGSMPGEGPMPRA